MPSLGRFQTVGCKTAMNSMEVDMENSCQAQPARQADDTEDCRRIKIVHAVIVNSLAL